MLVVVALGGNAILQRGEPLEADVQQRNIVAAAKAIAELAKEHDVILTHGNGPQVGLLLLQNEAFKEVSSYPLDVLGAETQGMIGYMFEMALRNEMGDSQIACLLTQTTVDPADPAFEDPTKYVGPVYTQEQATELARTKGYQIKADGEHFRRVVPSPLPKSIVELETIRQLVGSGSLVICGGGGGTPVAQDDKGQYYGVEAVIDKDLVTRVLANDLKADVLLILTDVEGVAVNWGQPDQKTINTATPEQMDEMGFAAGSMGPKVDACSEFIRNGGKVGGIGRLVDAADIVRGVAGTRIVADSPEITYY